MKKIILSAFFAASLAGSIMAQPAVISGVWNRQDSPKTLVLYRVTAGWLDTLSTCFLQDDNSFAFAFNVPQEGFYTIGNGRPKLATDKYTFYFKPGDALSVEVNDSTYVLTGKNTEENMALTEWHDYIHPLEYASYYWMKKFSTFQDFFPRIQKEADHPYKPKATKNKTFNRLFARYIEADFMNIAVSYFETPRKIHPTPADYPDFYRNTNIPKFTQDDFLLSYPQGAALAVRLLMRKATLNNRPFHEVPIEDRLADITNEQLKGEIVIMHSMTLRSYVDYTNLMNKYGHYVTLPDQQRRATEVLSEIAATLQPGQQAVNFTGIDTTGKVVALTDFKGKMVYVDVWATWCGPCIAEIPHLKKIIADYAGKDVVFMSISIDSAKDREKWRNFVKNRELQGVQIYGGNGYDSDVAKIYGISAIPRFLLIDKQGNIVSTDAPRPSLDTLRELINKGLSE